MKLRPVTKLCKRNKTTSKNDDVVLSANCDVNVFFRYLVNLERSGIRILDA